MDMPLIGALFGGPRHLGRLSSTLNSSSLLLLSLLSLWSLAFANGSVPSSPLNPPPCERVRFSGSLPASSGFGFPASRDVCDFCTLPLGLVARIMLSLVRARMAAASAFSLTFLPSSPSLSEDTSTQPIHPFFLGVAFLTAMPFFADRGVVGGFVGVVGVVFDGDDARHV